MLQTTVGEMTLFANMVAISPAMIIIAQVSGVSDFKILIHQIHDLGILKEDLIGVMKNLFLLVLGMQALSTKGKNPFIKIVKMYTLNK